MIQPICGDHESAVKPPINQSINLPFVNTTSHIGD